MHYNAYAFTSNNQPTIVPVDPGVPLQILGQRTGLSEEDLQHIQALYCADGENSSISFSFIYNLLIEFSSSFSSKQCAKW